jgi:hypothetical protein
MEVKTIEQRQAAIKSMSHVVALPSGSPERWKATLKHFIMQRPDAKLEITAITQYCKEQRTSLDKFGRTKNSRKTMATPSFLLPLLRQTDPEYFMSVKSSDLVGIKHLTIMKKAFPEFFIPEVI